jgi:hypothetical protein
VVRQRQRETVLKLRNKIALAAATVSATIGFAAPAANAGVLVQSATNCSSQQATQPFARWLDYSSYILAPGGALETGAGPWSLSGAGIVAGNESYFVHGTADSRSLSLPAGSSATTGTVCVGLSRPTLRFFARSSSTLTLSTLNVEALVEDSLGGVVALPIGVVTPNSRWQPSLPMPIVANLLPLLPGSQTPVAFRFTPVGAASWWIDDVYVDPKSRS